MQFLHKIYLLRGKNMYRISFETTNKCNMRCKYCYLEHEQEPLSVGTAMKAVDTFLREDVEHSGLEVSFIGGEPLLCKKNIIEITENIKKKMDEMKLPVTFLITTNATLLNKDIIDFFIKENYSLKISLDGCQEDHDINRLMLNKKSSYSEILSKLDILQQFQIKSGKLVQISMVISKETYRNVYSNIIHLIKLGFKFICPCLETYADWKDEELEIIEKQLKLTIDWMMNEAKNGNHIFLKPLVIEHSKRTSHYDCLYCFPGRNSMHIKVNGDIYACYACQKDEFKLGNVEIGFIEEKYLKYKTYKPEYTTKCLNCDIFAYCCAKECIAVNYERTGKKWEVPECFCKQAKMYNELYTYFINQKKVYFG